MAGTGEEVKGPGPQPHRQKLKINPTFGCSSPSHSISCSLFEIIYVIPRRLTRFFLGIVMDVEPLA